MDNNKVNQYLDIFLWFVSKDFYQHYNNMSP